MRSVLPSMIGELSIGNGVQHRNSAPDVSLATKIYERRNMANFGRFLFQNANP